MTTSAAGLAAATPLRRDRYADPLRATALGAAFRGSSHMRAQAAVERRDGTHADLARSRAGRLLRPAGVFAARWLVFASLVGITGYDRGR